MCLRFDFLLPYSLLTYTQQSTSASECYSLSHISLNIILCLLMQLILWTNIVKHNHSIILVLQKHDWIPIWTCIHLLFLKSIVFFCVLFSLSIQVKAWSSYVVSGSHILTPTSLSTPPSQAKKNHFKHLHVEFSSSTKPKSAIGKGKKTILPGFFNVFLKIPEFLKNFPALFQ